MESITNPENVIPTSQRATFSEGELESIKSLKNVNPISQRATFSEEEHTQAQKRKPDVLEGDV